MLLYTLLWMSVAFTISKTDSENATSSNLIPCNDGWFFYDNKCYKMFGDTQRLKWKQASEKCAEENGSLVTISSLELQVFLVMFLLLRTQNDAWIGLHDRVSEGQFTWDDGSTYTYSYWDKYQPTGTGDNREQEDCVQMRYSSFRNALGTWNDQSCETELHFVCQADKSDTVLSRDPRFCTIEEGEGWKYLNDCYHIVTEAKSWEDAESHCKEIYSGHLVTILNEPTEMFLNYITSNYHENFWIGIKMRDHDIQKWSSGLHVIYAKCDIERKCSMPGSCVATTGRKLWEIGPCHRKLPFICEKSDKTALILKKAPEGWVCPPQSDEWQDLGGEYCYTLETKMAATWEAANYQCVRRGGTLASIHSEAETYVLQPYLKKSQQVFIGLHRSYSNKNVFEWIDGSPLSYINWNTGEPNHRDEECGEIWTGPMGWNDIPCNKVKDYICSAKKVPPTLQTNSSVPNECVCTSSLNITSHEVHSLTSTSATDICSSGISTKTVTGIVICILLIIFLTGVVVYQYRNQPFCKKLYNASSHKDSNVPPFNYISSEIIVKPDEYECSM